MGEAKKILLQLPPELAEELRRAQFDERMSATELLIQGLVLRLRMPGRDSLPVLLGKLGYQGRPAPGRPRRVTAEANGQGPPGTLPGPADVADDGWGLEE